MDRTGAITHLEPAIRLVAMVRDVSLVDEDHVHLASPGVAAHLVLTAPGIVATPTEV